VYIKLCIANTVTADEIIINVRQVSVNLAEVETKLTLLLQFSSRSFTDERQHGSQATKHTIKKTLLTGSAVHVTCRTGGRGGRSIE